MGSILFSKEFEERLIKDTFKSEYGINLNKIGDVYEARDDNNRLIAMSSQLDLIVMAVCIAYDIDLYKED